MMNIRQSKLRLGRAIVAIACGVCCVSMMGCSTVVRTATQERQPLRYVGDIAFGKPTGSKNASVVPVSFSGGEWHQNSAIVPDRIKANLRNGEIEVFVTTAVAGNDNPSANRMMLRQGLAGSYPVYYLDPDGTRHYLTTVSFPN